MLNLEKENNRNMWENFDKKATIFFENIGQKQLLLRFAKLEI